MARPWLISYLFIILTKTSAHYGHTITSVASSESRICRNEMHDSIPNKFNEKNVVD